MAVISEERFERLVNTIDGIVYEYDQEGIEMVYVSQQCLTILGYTQAEFKAKGFWEAHLHPDDRQEAVSTCDYHVDRREPHILEYRFFHKNGSIRWIRELVSVGSSKGRGLSVQGILIDVTAEKEIQASLAKSEERFQLAVKASTDAMWDYDIRKDELYLSPHYEEMTGFTPEELPNNLNQFIDTMIHIDDHEMVVSKVEFYLERRSTALMELEHRLLRKDNTYIWVRVKGIATCDEDDKPIRFTGFTTNIDEHKKAQDKLAYQATHDELTGLANRRQLTVFIRQLLAKTPEDKCNHALCIIDLDQFKLINDTCGHPAGDAYLISLAKTLKQKIPLHSLVARLGGDEFALMITNHTLEQARLVAESINTCIQDKTFVWGGKSINVSASIGLVAVNNKNEPINELIQHADTACYLAKDTGRNRICVYNDQDSNFKKNHTEFNWLDRLRHALRTDGFRLYAQTIDSRTVNGGRQFEILLRINDSGKLVSPDHFLPTAERYNISPQLDSWVVKHCIRKLSNKSGLLDHIDLLFLNISGKSFSDQYFFSFMNQALAQRSELCNKLCLEVTETAVIQDLEKAQNFMWGLKKLGVRFALDDFGTGLSSFIYLKKLPVDYLKIDGVFIKDMLSNEINTAMVKSINEIGHIMGLKTIAEYVQSEEVAQKLDEIGVDYQQGFHIAKPEPLENLFKPSANIAKRRFSSIHPDTL